MWEVRAAAIAAVLAAAAPARAERPALRAATMIGAAWMNAAYKTPQALDDAVALTGLPFAWEGAVYLDPGSAASCAKVGARGSAADAAAVRPVLDCLRHGTAPLVDATDWTVVDPAALPAPLAAYRAQLAELAKRDMLVLVHAKGKGVEDWAVLAVRTDPDHDGAFVDAFVAAHRGR